LAKDALSNLSSSLKKHAYLSSIKTLFNKNSDKTSIKTIKQKNAYKYSIINEEFTNSIKNAPSNHFTIVLGKLDKSNINSFIENYVLNKKTYAVLNSQNTASIISGLYENDILANEAILNIHPNLFDKAKIVSIQSIR